jgi:hypothetical protein
VAYDATEGAGSSTRRWLSPTDLTSHFSLRRLTAQQVSVGSRNKTVQIALMKRELKEIQMKIFALLLLLGAIIGAAAPAHAKGCIKGAIAGGVAGHMVGHGAAGAAAGCVIGHHEANKRQNTNQNR